MCMLILAMALVAADMADKETNVDELRKVAQQAAQSRNKALATLAKNWLEAGDYRMWSEKTGQDKTEARYHGLGRASDGAPIALLQTKDGREISIPVEKLSSDDRRHLTKIQMLTTTLDSQVAADRRARAIYLHQLSVGQRGPVGNATVRVVEIISNQEMLVSGSYKKYKTGIPMFGSAKIWGVWGRTAVHHFLRRQFGATLSCFEGKTPTVSAGTTTSDLLASTKLLARGQVAPRRRW